jgi:RNA polymerase sigma-70 factor (ECF subfamily)
MDRDLTASFALVRQAKEGDRAALARVVERYYDRILRIVRARLGPGLRHCTESQDLVQETFAAAVRDFEHFDVREEASLVHWFARLAERQILRAAEYHRAERRDPGRVEHAHREASDPALAAAASSPGPSTRAVAQEQRELVEDCLHELPDEYRELILLRDYAGVSWQEMARVTGRPSPDAARVMHVKAVEELSKLLRRRGLREP